MRKSTPIEDRFFLKVRQEGDCWVWTDKLHHGYGRIGTGADRVILAHRWSYEYLRAEIPAGLQLDHLCRNRACVNPWHLEPVTNAVNSARGQRAMTTHCPRGHAYDAENTMVRPKPYGACRVCRTCENARRRALRESEPSKANGDKTHCKRGHEFTDENTRMTLNPNGGPKRSCIACERERRAANRIARRDGMRS